MQIHLDSVLSTQKFAGAYLKTFQKIVKELYITRTKEEVNKYLEELIVEIDVIIERLEIDGEHKPLRLMGMKATYDLMNKIYTSLLTVMFAIL